MPSVKTITPLLGGGYYHIFNRGINRQLLFFQERNYFHFLELLKKYVADYADVLAYCLLPNHFHLVIRIKDVIFQKDDILEMKKEDETGKFVSNQFRKLFVAYTMAINKQECRTGNLFDRTFKRLEITEHEYLQYVIFYSHYNPEKHGITTNFKNFRFSSYSAFLSKQNTSISRDLVFEIFDGKEGFISYHNVMHDERENLQLE
jgi:REP element-mobilizing transposase RayT